ncbi:MAG: FtsX-like permease family protein [Truepera sp.]|nr:FtsX-like permease family protein [Truepera sp.]
MILLKIAFRNLREHRTKTLIIGTLIALGIAFLVIGNSVMATITRSMEASFVENFTGGLILRTESEEDVAFIGGFGEAPEILENYTDITAYLETLEDVEGFTPILSSAASISNDEGALSFALLWGIEPSSYFEIFPDRFVLNEGELLRDGEEGILLSQGVIDDVLDEHGVALAVGDTILLSGQNDVTGTKVREVTIRGTGFFENAVGLLDRISFVDANTLRTLTGLTAVQVDRQSSDLAATESLSENALFGGNADSLFSTPLIDEGGGDEVLDFDNILGDTSVRDRFLAIDNNAWHFLLLDVADGTSLRALSGQIREAEAISDTLMVENWRWGAGFIAELAFGIRNILNIIILVISVVAIIIIMNTLVISVTERIAEIGTVRAIGGQKSFVRGMITTEVLMITVVFGVVGMAIGSLVIGVFNVVGLPASNLFLQILFGGSTLNPVLSFSSLFTSLGIVAIIGVIASLYPASVALGIAPVQAMQRN